MIGAADRSWKTYCPCILVVRFTIYLETRLMFGAKKNSNIVQDTFWFSEMSGTTEVWITNAGSVPILGDSEGNGFFWIKCRVLLLYLFC